MEFIEAKKILSSWSNGDSWFGCNYGMNIYKGCCHGCIYCDSRSECYRVDNFDKVRAKKNVLLTLENDLKSKRKKGIVATGAMSDSYNPFEEKYELTRGALELINKYGFGASVLTKSDLVVRDIDILSKIKEHSPAMAKFTITTYDDELCKKIEPNVSVTSRRFKALKEISEAGIFTGILMCPILPFINDTDENIKLIVKAAAENGASFVSPYLGVTLRQNQRLYFYQQLDILFPGLKQKYISTFGGQYECNSLYKNRLWIVFKTECDRYGLLYRMTDIIKELKRKYENKQMSLF
ncbi:radical SAM protein [Proteiniborus sp. MB09-C3]|uniref:SPL family radical SAM protein n=1 Tax=Proteiniborus sp. MB09-C3 TaxID=3050072 RepID=UPI0025540C5F|nr:radical SAM protein [Proteiniborus sp. MB09-C3]WIV12438.1 radical SAM protein [Proteiniborus sp. MB09-C3]